MKTVITDKIREYVEIFRLKNYKENNETGEINLLIMYNPNSNFLKDLISELKYYFSQTNHIEEFTKKNRFTFHSDGINFSVRINKYIKDNDFLIFNPSEELILDIDKIGLIKDTHFYNQIDNLTICSFEILNNTDSFAKFNHRALDRIEFCIANNIRYYRSYERILTVDIENKFRYIFFQNGINEHSLKECSEIIKDRISLIIDKTLKNVGTKKTK